MAILDKFRLSKQPKIYNPDRLVDHQIHEDVGHARANIQLICDIDKTYLETAFESVLKMAKIALEDAEDKVTVLGAQDFLSLFRWGSKTQGFADVEEKKQFPRPVHFVSSSPPMLRKTLQEKMSLDGIDWTSDTFKNQAYNIKKGRFDLLKQQSAYKSLAILKLIATFPESSSFYLLGDNAEADPYIYLGLFYFLNGQLDQDGYLKYLQIAGVEEDQAIELLSKIAADSRGKIAGIYIRCLRDYPFVESSPLTDPIFWFDNYFNLILLNIHQGLIHPEDLWPVVQKFHNRYAFTLADLDHCLERFSQFSDEKIFLEVRRKITSYLNPQAQFSKKTLIHIPQTEPAKKLSQSEILTLAQSYISKVR